MRAVNFWISLLVLAVLTLASLYFIDLAFPRLHAFSRFTFLTTLIFTAIVGLAYLIGSRAAQSQSRSRFIAVMMALIFLKMVVCIGLVLGYIKLYEPTNKLFVLPFLMIYLIFTIFEVIVLQKVARLEPADSSATD